MEEKENKIEFNKFEKIFLYLTGYGPFDTVKENPAEIVVNFLYGIKQKLETNFTSILYKQIFEVTTVNVDNNINQIYELVEKNSKNKNILNIIISFGVAESRLVNTIETRAQNYIYDYIKDQKIIEEKDDSLNSKNPIEYIVKEIQKEVKCKFSQDAGTYLCNYIFFKTLNHFWTEDNICSFFIHVPKLSNCKLDEHLVFFRCLINALENLYIKGNEEKKTRMLECQINEGEDEHVDSWNSKRKKKKEVKNDTNVNMA